MRLRYDRKYAVKNGAINAGSYHNFIDSNNHNNTGATYVS